MVVWRYPVRPAAGAAPGQLVLEIDLQALNRQLLSAVPAQAVVTVTDASRTILLRSTEPAAAIGQRPGLDAAEPARGAREGFFEGAGLDGRARLYAEVEVPGLGWRVMAGLPVDHVFEGYRHVLKRTIAIGVVLGLGALALGWQLSAAIVRPVADLRRLVARVAAGDVSARSPATGPPELRAVAQAFNQMLDARALSESRLRGIFEAAVDAIITADEQQTIVEANPAAAAMFRCRLDEMVGAPLERFIPLRYRAAHQRDVQRFGEATLAARHMGAQRDVMALRADGEEFPIEASISHVSVGGRRLFTVIHRDVTERRRVEAALSQSESRLRRLLIHLPEAVYVSRGEHISFANHAAQRLFGTDEAGLLGHSPLEFIHDASQAAVTAHLASLGEGAPVTTLAEVQVQRADGSLRWAQSLATLVEGDADGSVLVVMRDVTDLRQAQAALQASHADLTRLVAALDSVQEEERKRIARELHDDLQQTLAAIRMDIGAAGADLCLGLGQGGAGTAARIQVLLQRQGRDRRVRTGDADPAVDDIWHH